MDKSIFYSLCDEDIQEVANDLLDRNLTETELSKVREAVPDFIQWYDAIENAIHSEVSE